MIKISILFNFPLEFLCANRIRKITTLKIEPGSFVDADLKQHHSDILYSLKVNGMHGYVYLNLEHQSTAEELMPFRMHRYKVAIMQQHLNLGYKKLPVVISMLFYHGKGQLKQQGRQESLQQGRYEEDLKIAKKMLARGYEYGAIKDLLGLSDQDLLHLVHH